MTHLVRGVENRLIIYAFDAQHDLETIPITIRGLSQNNVRVYHSPLSDFFLALLPRNCLDRAQEARYFIFTRRMGWSMKNSVSCARDSRFEKPTRVTGGEELFGVVSCVTTPAERFRDRQLEVERSRLVSGRRGDFAGAPSTCGSGGHLVLDSKMTNERR
jgi:hypothetical protein